MRITLTEFAQLEKWSKESNTSNSKTARKHLFSNGKQSENNVNIETINTQLRENSERLVKANKDIKILKEALRQMNNAMSKKPFSKEIIMRGLEYL
jgi:6-phosphogluconolactonase/glucosamine-6-phosphate isomerase/deaminase